MRPRRSPTTSALAISYGQIEGAAASAPVPETDQRPGRSRAHPVRARFIDRARLRADSSSQRALSALEAAEKVELGPDGWQVSDPLFALWLARSGTAVEGE